MEDNNRALSQYRYKRCLEELQNARTTMDAGLFKLALNRSYYSIFYGIRAINVLDGFDSSKHSGVIAHFNQYHVKNGDFPPEVSKIIKSASIFREQADYEDFFVASRLDAKVQIENAEIFAEIIGQFLQENDILAP